MAGLNLALLLSEHGQVTVLSKKNPLESSSAMAQGGIAAVLDPQDSFVAHVEDTLQAGSHHNNRAAVEFLVQQAPAAIARLESFGVHFEKKAGLEGGHSFSRIQHTFDQTGFKIMSALMQAVQENTNITVVEDAPLIDLILQNEKCLGATFLKNDKVELLEARATILATGGLGQLYSYTSNPSLATGDGIAIAHRAGAKLKDLEFIQFHPTGFLFQNSSPFLLSETLRGAGAILRNAREEDFMTRYHPLGSLAPRDEVSRAIFDEQKKGPVYLDLRHLDAKYVRTRFPYLKQKLSEYHLDISQDLIPITPVAHYLCGGIAVDLQGKTSLPHLYALGECACTGVHGANRLASNSLLENMVFAKPIVESICQQREQVASKEISLQLPKNVQFYPRSNQIQNLIKETMWNLVGIKRSQSGLAAALKIFESMEAAEDYETRNMLAAAKLVTQAALERKSSLGCHWVEI